MNDKFQMTNEHKYDLEERTGKFGEEITPISRGRGKNQRGGGKRPRGKGQRDFKRN